MTTPKRLLSLDGGGVRGLSSLLILRDLMSKVGHPGMPLPKPCDYFDLIGGTSTGGLIAIMLGRLEMTVDECIDAYMALSTEIFSNPRRSSTFSKVKPLLGGIIEANYSAANLERIIKKITKRATGSEDSLLKNPHGRCKVFVCAMNNPISRPVRFKSYYTSDPDDLIDCTTIWQACRATSAAKTFFDPMVIKGEAYSDGGCGRNNPVREVWRQAREIWRLSELQLYQSLTCFVSIGTGVPTIPAKANDTLKDIFKLLQKIALETQDTAREFAREKIELRLAGRYYRFNVETGLYGIKLDEAAKLTQIATATREYTRTEFVKVSVMACADALAGRRYASSSDHKGRWG